MYKLGSSGVQNFRAFAGLAFSVKVLVSPAFTFTFIGSIFRAILSESDHFGSAASKTASARFPRGFPSSKFRLRAFLIAGAAPFIHSFTAIASAPEKSFLEAFVTLTSNSRVPFETRGFAKTSLT